VLQRLPACILLAATALLVAATPVLASGGGHDGGEGWLGETNDKVVTNAGFVLIIFFPLFIFFVSIIQWRLEKRKDLRKAADKARAKAPGGW